MVTKVRIWKDWWRRDKSLEEAIPNHELSNFTTFVNLIDKPCWKGSQDGGFSSAATYDIIVEKYQLDSDGCLRVRLGTGGFGGLFRNEKGAWISGYYGILESRTSLEAELWAIYKGLTILLQRRFTKVIVETNAEQVVQLLKEGPGDNFPFQGLIIMRGCECEVNHVM
ncbi:hypothetical protein ACSBR1_033540 [Camellia fascicularis]